MPDGGMSKRERESERQEREPELTNYTDFETGESIIIPSDQAQEHINESLRQHGINPDNVIETLIIPPPTLKELREKRHQERIESMSYSVRMLTGNKDYLAKKMNKVEGEQALNQVMKKSGLYSGMATIIPGIGTAAGFLIGGSVAIAEVFVSNANQKTAKDMLRDFITSLFNQNDVTQETVRAFSFTTIEPIMFRADINKIINIIKQTFKNTPLQQAADSLYLSETQAYFVVDICNIAKFRVNKTPKPVTGLDIKKIGLIGAGLLALRFLIFKG